MDKTYHLCCHLFFVALTSVSAMAFDLRTVTLVPSKDNTIYEELGDTGCEQSNGAGQYFFVGLPVDPTPPPPRGPSGARRALIAFDIAKRIPAECYDHQREAYPASVPHPHRPI